MFDAVRRFVALAGQTGVKGSDPELKRLMVKLRRAGFTSSEISELSGGKWSGTLVRQYTADWGGVDKALNSERKNMMATLRGLAASGRGVEDVEHTLGLEASAKSRGSSLEEQAELSSYLRQLDTQLDETGRLVALSRDLLSLGLKPAMVRAWMELDKQLAEEGFTQQVRRYLQEASQKYGGVVAVLRAILEYAGLQEIQGERLSLEARVKQLESEVEALSREREELGAEIRTSKDLINAANQATIAGFNPGSLMMVSVMAEKLGGPYKVIDAVKKYESLKQLDEEIAAKNAELEKTKMEVSNQGHLIRVLGNILLEVKLEYSRNKDVRGVVELLANPRGMRLDRAEVAWLLTRVLDSSVLRIKEAPDPLRPPSPEWDATLESIKALAERLQPFCDEMPAET